MTRVLVLLLGFGLLLSGCTNNYELGEVSEQDLILNPGEYGGKEITVTAIPHSPYFLGPKTNFKYYLDSEDMEGKPVYLLVDYEEFWCHKCQMTGVIESFETCECQQKSWTFDGGEVWLEDELYMEVYQKDKCESLENHRCKPGGEIGKDYVFKVDSVVKVN